jgi:ABC-type bacteriocin/lantibiotic exporters, contain an N-terminal double-glycine peptidase domain
MTKDNKIKKQKEAKKKPPYSVWQNFKFIFANVWKWDKPLLFLSLLRVPVNVLTPMIGIYMSKYVIDTVTTNGSIERLLLYILLFSLATFALRALSTITEVRINWKAVWNRLRYFSVINEKYIDADYENVEDPDGQTKYDKAGNTIQGDNSGTQAIISNVIDMLSNVFGLISYSSIIFTLNPWIVLALSITTVGNYFIYEFLHKWEYRNRDNWTPIDRKLYYIKRIAGDFSSAKDIRLYNISDWFKDLFASTLKERFVWSKKQKKATYAADIGTVILCLIRDGIAYGYLIYKMLNSDMAVSDFVLYFGIIGGFSGWLSGLIYKVTSLREMSLGICDLREFIDLPDKFNRGKGIALPSETSEIEFRNVSFKYSGSDKNTIENLSFKIKKGEKIAIVGLNGAGKTTLIKLMCGLYAPIEGEILVDGKPIMEYNRDEYYTLFSAVFQDINLMPVSIAQNIALSDYNDIDRDRMVNVMKLSGIYDKVQSLDKGMDTLLVKSFHDDAIELSGGEKQKLALSRALYKDGKIIILDEPTAALDPIAENEMYQKYDELTSGRTAVYISHRLSSTRFCDRIFFLEDGNIIETGNHVDLMKQGGKYAEMFDIQSHYYKNGQGKVIENEEAVV